MERPLVRFFAPWPTSGSGPKRRLACLSLFWHFLDIIWIGVFTFVYLMGILR